MKVRHILIIIATIAMMILYFFKDYQRTVRSVGLDIEENDEPQAAQEPRVSGSQSPTTPITPLPVSSTPEATAAVPPVQGARVSESVARKFGTHMVNLEKCFGSVPSVSADSIQNPDPTNLLNLLRNNLGEPILQQDDWTQFDTQDSSGAKKRIRVDFEYPDGVTPRRRLSIYNLNAYGSYEIENLTNDQADNPNEAYVESLKEGLRVVHQEKGARMFFALGEEFVYTDRNGLLDSVTIYKGEKTYTCTYLSDDRSNCSCM